MNNILWLASYPKSGNTWFRVFLSNLLSEDPVDINNLSTDSIASARAIFDHTTAMKSSYLTMEEIDALRPEVYEHLSNNATRHLYVKIHDAYTILADKRPLIPQTATFKVIYIVRNPLDVSISFSHHNSCDIDNTITNMRNSGFCFCDNIYGCPNQLRQKLLSWGEHVVSWLESPLDVLCLRYEDMKLHAKETFTTAVRFMEIECSDQQIESAIKNSDIKSLKEQEQQNSFREKPMGMESFFRKGEVGAWRGTLSDEQVKQLVDDHQDVMRRLEYIDDKGNLLC